MKCIICLKEKELFSKEHVIPEVLGGVYIINSVCKTCNSKLGNEVDIKIIDEFASINFRNEHELKGKSGKLPLVFPGTFNNLLNENEKYRFTHEENGSITPTLIRGDVHIEKDNTEENKFHIKICFDESMSKEEMEKQAKKIIEKEMKRRKMKFDIINQNIKKIDSEVSVSMGIDISSNDSFISILKMAYEFSVSNIEGYKCDEQGHSIARILREASYSQALNYVNGASIYIRPIDDGIEKIFPSRENKHFILLKNFGNKLGAMVYLNGIGFYCVKLSNKEYDFHKRPGGLLLVNDFKEKKHEITSLYDYICNCSSGSDLNV
ncbi:HNH endonuclease [Pectobacterium versatile]|uniref:HNH endonuclease n=1 Tax=Pectobacterium versatile TaxID=2488639 RepID=UPI001CF59281|nr:HNH endonuclease [Pectobacterium versatile]MCA6926042.1 HNH endonuclease [Pectobacterium versatile]MCH5082795.1 HNH endonuclease [Pectobacterium versatile]